MLRTTACLLAALFVAGSPHMAKGLAGDDRWFYIEECMEKT
jgi:hypothetical protein